MDKYRHVLLFSFEVTGPGMGPGSTMSCASVYDADVSSLSLRLEDLLEREARESQAETLEAGNWKMVAGSFSCYDGETYRMEAGLPVTRLTRTGWVEIPEALQYAFRTRLSFR